MSALTLILWAIAAFVAFWAGTVSLIGLGGWKPLAARFPAHRWPKGEGVLLTWQSGRLGSASYSGALNAIVTTDGVYLKPMALFAFNHPPVFIPWDAVEDVDKALFGGVTLRLRGGGGLALRGRVATEVRQHFDAWLATSAAPRRATRLTIEDEAPMPDDEAPGERERLWRRQARERG